MHRLLRVDPEQGWFECQPGYRFGELEARLRDTGLFFPPDPSSGEYATFGGMLATNASGAHSVKYGNTADYLLDGEVVFADGSRNTLSAIASTSMDRLPDPLCRLAGIYTEHASAIEAAYPPVACNVAGYNLRGLVQANRLHLHRLLAGAEGTLGIITRLRFRLVRRPAFDSLVVVYCDDIVHAARATQLAIPYGPAGIEIMDKSLLQLARDNDPVLADRIPQGVDNVLLIEFDGDSADDCRQLAERIRTMLTEEKLSHSAHLAVSHEEKERYWALRLAAVPILYKLKGRKKIIALVEDAAVPVDQLVPFYKGLYAIFESHKVKFVLYGHIAKGLSHARPLLDLKDRGDVKLIPVLAEAVYKLVSEINGTVSGEHGDGRLRTMFVKRRYPQIYALMAQTKALLDPKKILNPKIIIGDDDDLLTRDLRYGPDYADLTLGAETLNWDPRLRDMAELCHGCSKCTTVTDQTRMCPVFKVTRDEAAAPKAKANLLRALIGGAMNQRMLYHHQVQQVMDQCVNCGSCYLECPSNVNIPKLAMEAKARYAERFGTSLPHRITANVESAAHWLHPLASVIQGLARLPKVHQLVTRTTGLASQHRMVSFARRNFYQTGPSHISGNGPNVLFFVGCYAAYIRPELAHAAVDVMKQMGARIHIPKQWCCGLPHLSKGMVAAARGKVERNVNAWEALMADVDYVVVTCSSCGYALIQDWAYLIDEKRVGWLKEKVVHISQLVLDHGHRLNFKTRPVKLAYHQPCHLRLQPQKNTSLKVLANLPGVQIQGLGSHCCGMAGSWGLLAENYALSQAIGTPMLGRLNTSGVDVGVTDCPTCQMQMEHGAELPIRHPIEVVWESLNRR
jgi:Fe-S oxidoreductase/FAD/FMN-containing dehydrogenase